MTATSIVAGGAGERAAANGHRWRLIVIATIIMVLISPYEYTFTIFENPIAKAEGWSLSAVAMTYTIYIVVSALFMIPSGLWSDRWQPRWFTTAAGVITGVGWIAASFARTPVELWTAYGMGALGPGYIYANNVNNALKWFPEPRLRGRAVGIVNMGFGLGAGVFVTPLRHVIKASTFGYRGAFLWVGVLMLIVIVVLAQFLRLPERGWKPVGWDPGAKAGTAAAGGPLSAARDFHPGEVFRSWQYWYIVGELCFICTAGLMITAHVAKIAKSDIAVDGASIGVLAATLAPVPNGGMRWVAGQLSDRIGRERVMLVSFCTMGVATFAITLVHAGWLFVVLVFIAVGTWSPLFTVFPAIVADYWGHSHSGINYGIIYGPGKAIAGVFGGVLAAAIYSATGTWHVPFYVAAAMAFAAGLGVLGLRRPVAPAGADVGASGDRVDASEERARIHA